MYEMKISDLACAGPDALMIKLAAGNVQHKGIAVSTDQLPGTAMFGTQPFTGIGSWPSGLIGEGTTVSALGANSVKTVVRVRPQADAHVPGSPPRGAPV